MNNKQSVLFERSIDMDFRNLHNAIREVTDEFNKNFDKWLRLLISNKLNTPITEDYDINQLKGRVNIRIDADKRIIFVDGKYSGYWQIKTEPCLTSKWTVCTIANPTFDMQ